MGRERGGAEKERGWGWVERLDGGDRGSHTAMC